MPSEHIVVDGSNIATEGRSAPSLAQLEEAVSELKREFPDAEVTVIVDATFSHRIDPSELGRFEKKALEGEYVHPPAGAIGRGDAFLLRVAEKVNAITLSNDSFQEFHGEHPWLFDRGRLLGATPVPGVGWIFVPRTPVRGPRSRKATKDTEKEKRRISRAIEAATKEAVSPNATPREHSGRRSRATAEASQAPRQAENPAVSAVNDPLTFVSFIAEHPLGAEVLGRVDSYTSHGAVVFVQSVQCYVPLANMSVPAPRSAREVLKRGEERTFVVTALDPQRRGVELAVPGVAEVSGRPSAEMIEAEVRLAKKKATAPRKKAAASAPKRAAKKLPAATAPAEGTGTAKKAAKKTAATRKARTTTAEPTAGSAAAAAAKKAAARPRRRSPAAAKKEALPRVEKKSQGTAEPPEEEVVDTGGSGEGAGGRSSAAPPATRTPRRRSAPAKTTPPEPSPRRRTHPAKKATS